MLSIAASMAVAAFGRSRSRDTARCAPADGSGLLPARPLALARPPHRLLQRRARERRGGPGRGAHVEPERHAAALRAPLAPAGGRGDPLLAEHGLRARRASPSTSYDRTRGRAVRAIVRISRPDPLNAACTRWALTLVTAHELGHALGLDHETRRCALMNPTLANLSPQGCQPLLPPWQWRCRVLERDDVRGAVRIYGGRVKRRPRAVCDLFALPATPGSLTAAPDGTGGLAISFARPATRTPAAARAGGAGQLRGGLPSRRLPRGARGGRGRGRGPHGPCPTAGCRPRRCARPSRARVCVAVWARDGVGRFSPAARDRRSSTCPERTRARRLAGACGGRGASLRAMPVPAPVRLRRPTFGSQLEPLGRYQFQSPSSFIDAGSSTPRTSVASIRTAAARPDAELLHVDERERGEDREHPDHHHRRRGHHAGRGLDAVGHGLIGRTRPGPPPP